MMSTIKLLDDMPRLSKISTATVPNISAIQITRIRHYQKKQDKISWYSNGYYNMVITIQDDNFIGFESECSNGLYRIDLPILNKKKAEANADKDVAKLKRPQKFLTPDEVMSDESVVRNITLKTLYDLNSILVKEFGCRCISQTTETNIKCYLGI